jgi:hypothetical protein
VGSALVASAFMLAIVVLGARAVRRRLVEARRPASIAVASFDDIPGQLRRRRCPCGRQPDMLGELPTAASITVTRECVCGRVDRVVFVLAH